MRYRAVCVLVLLFCAVSLSLNAQSLVTDVSVPSAPYAVAVNWRISRVYVRRIRWCTSSLNS